MPDMSRGDLSRLVYSLLCVPSFRSKLVATTSDGAKPIVIALRSDLVGGVLREVTAHGGNANVVVEAGEGVVILSIDDGPAEQIAANDGDVPTLTSDCTVGVLMARLFADGDRARYRFVSPGPEGSAPVAGSAQLVGAAG